MIWIIGISTIIAAYLIGSINPSIILSKALYGSDIRKSGSGNAGTTNMLRTHGKKVAVLTLLCDVLKGVIPVLLAYWVNYFTDSPMLPYMAGFFAVVGHNFPLFFGFKGGKGVATTLGVVLAINLLLGIIVMVIAVAIMAATRYVSLGSCIGAVLFPILYLITSLIGDSFDVMSLIFASALGLLIIVRHHSNIKRLLNGTENKLFAKKE